MLRIHGINHSEGFHPYTEGTDPFQAGLISLFNDNSRPGQLDTCVPDQLDQAHQSSAVGKKIINDQDFVLRTQKFLGH